MLGSALVVLLVAMCLEFLKQLCVLPGAYSVVLRLLSVQCLTTAALGLGEWLGSKTLVLAFMSPWV